MKDWSTALTGLRVLMFHSQEHGKETGEWVYFGEVTGCTGNYLYVVPDGEEYPEYHFWTDVRPMHE